MYQTSEIHDIQIYWLLDIYIDSEISLEDKINTTCFLSVKISCYYFLE